MIINKAKLLSFGGLADRSFTFKEGLNVLCGPNEAGKSTLVNALYAALFVPAGVKKSEEAWTAFLQYQLPHPAADTAAVELEFETEAGDKLQLSRAWGSGKGEKLLLNKAGEIHDPAEIKRQLELALRYGRATYRDILFARQEEMNKTLQRLQTNEEAAATLADLLRAALFEVGGISLEKLEGAINSEYERLLNNWDLAAGEPRGGRGIANPHKTKLGDVQKAYYHAGELKQKLGRIRNEEEKIDAVNRRLANADKVLADLGERLKKAEKLEPHILQRALVEPQLETLQAKESHLMKVISEWPKIEERVKNLKESAESRQKDKTRLEKELQEAIAALEACRKRELYDRVMPLREAIDENKKKLEKLPPLDKDILAGLEDIAREVERLKAITGAMKLKAHLKTGKPFKLKITSGVDQTEELFLEKDAEIQGAGRLVFESAEWQIAVQSGEQDVAALLEEAQRCSRLLADKLDSNGMRDLEEARQASAAFRELQNEINTGKTKLETILGEVDFEVLKREVAGLQAGTEMRDPEEIRKDLDHLRDELGEERVRLEQEEEKLKSWAEEFESLNQAISRVADLRRELGDINKELDSLEPLPEEYESSKQFFDELKKLREHQGKLQKEVVLLKEELYTAQRKLPDESAEELEAELEEAERWLARLRSEAEAVQLVKDEFEKLKEELDSQTYQPLVEKFTRYLALLTGNRYAEADFKGSLPGGISTGQGKFLPLQILSSGTTSGVALALRLAIAACLLEGLSGFMVMDDPLVHLDPERRRAAAALIAEFAAGRQLIITTCDPRTAELLGGNLINA